MRLVLIVTALIAVASASAAAEEPKAAETLPKSNPLARAKIVSKNPLSITITHSKWGQETAFKWAEAHCAEAGRVAVHSGSAAPIGTGITSTWRCERVD